MGFSGAIGSKGFDNSIGAGGVELPDYKRLRVGVNVPKAENLAMWFMAVPNGKGRRTFSKAQGNRVRVLRDCSGNRNHLRQNTASKQPTILQGVQSNRAAFSFASNDFLVGTNDSAFDVGTGAFDVYIILNFDAISSGFQTFFSTKSAATSGAAGIAAFANASEKVRAQGADGSSQKNTTITSNAYNGNGFFLVRVSRINNRTMCTYTLCSDGTTESKTVSATGVNFDGGNFAIGGLNNGNNTLQGKVVELLAFKGIRLTDSERDKVVSYLSTKYKLGL